MPISGSARERSHGSIQGNRIPGVIDGDLTLVGTPYSVATNFFQIYYGAAGWTFSESNMRAVATASPETGLLILPKQYGKWALEIECVIASGAYMGLRGAASLALSSSFLGEQATDYTYVASNGNKRTNNTLAAYGATWTSGDKITILWDADVGTLSFAKNGADQGVAYSGLSGAFYPGVGTNNAGNDFRVATTLTYAFPGYLQWR